MNFEQKRTLILVVAAFLVGLSMAVLSGCATEHDYQAPDAMSAEIGGDPTGPGRGPGLLADAPSTLETPAGKDSADMVEIQIVDLQPSVDARQSPSDASEAPADASEANPPPDLPKDLTPPDLTRDLPPPDLTPKLNVGTTCSTSAQCGSGHCTDGVCCTVDKCVDTCVPTTTACPPYNGFTCAPYGTCRAF